MLDNFIFENHLGQRFEGKKNGVYLNYNGLRDFSWNYDTINSRISRFYRAAKSYSIPLVINCKTDSEGIAVKNRLLELAEVDVLAALPGKICIGDYYLSGYITGSKKSNYLISKRYCEIQLTLTTDNPAWYREQKHVFVPGGDSAIGTGGGTDYSYDYPYDYALSLTGRSIFCDSVKGNAFKLLIYGSAPDPAITISGHTYAISGSVGVGETLLVDSLSKTITLTTARGKKVNWFDKRNRESYIFEPIAAGQNTVSWIGTFGFDLTVIEERSEPKWT